MCQRPSRQLLDDLVRLKQEQRENLEAEGLSGLQIDDEFEPRGRLHREVCRLDVFEDVVDVGGGGMADGTDVRRMGKTCALRRSLLPVARERQALVSD
jgi:hypothetical protein